MPAARIPRTSCSDRSRPPMPLLTHSHEPPARSGQHRNETIRFCSRCGGPDETLARPARAAPPRLRALRHGSDAHLPGDALPGPGAAFMVVTAELAVSAVSRSGDKLFGEEGELTGSHLLASSRARSGTSSSSTTSAARPPRPPRDGGAPGAPGAGGRARGGHAVGARIATCGPPHARRSSRSSPAASAFVVAEAAGSAGCAPMPPLTRARRGARACAPARRRTTKPASRHVLRPRKPVQRVSTPRNRGVDVRSSAATLTRSVDWEVK